MKLGPRPRYIITLAACLGPALPAQTRVDFKAQGRNADLSAFSYTKPFKTGTSLPATCSVGEVYFRLDATAGQNLHLCTAADTWSQVIGGGGGGGTGLEVVSASEWTADGRVAVTDGVPGRNIRQTAIAYDGTTLTIPGGLSVGTGSQSGLQWTLGNAGDTGPSSLILRGGDGTANSEPGYLSAFSSHPSSPFQSFLFPCGAAGKWCASAATPGADSTNFLLSAAGPATLQYKTLDSTNTLSGYLDVAEIPAPAAPAAGYQRLYAKVGSTVCAKSAGGSETCLGGGPGAGDPDSVSFVLDGGGAAITPGTKGWIRVPYNGTITSVELTADQAGSIVLDLWKDTYANFPPTVADTITASAKPTLSSAQKYQDLVLTGWTTTVTAGDYVRLNVDSAGTVTYVVLNLQIARN